MEGKGKRIGWALGSGAGVLLLVCGGGLAALIGLGTAATGALKEQARVVIGTYLDTLHSRAYSRAYTLLCQEARDRETVSEYTHRVAQMDPIASYKLGELNLINMTVPVDATYANGGKGRLAAYLGQNRSTGAFEVCDLGE